MRYVVWNCRQTVVKRKGSIQDSKLRELRASIRAGQLPTRYSEVDLKGSTTSFNKPASPDSQLGIHCYPRSASHPPSHVVPPTGPPHPTPSHPATPRPRSRPVRPPSSSVQFRPSLSPPPPRRSLSQQSSFQRSPKSQAASHVRLRARYVRYMWRYVAPCE